jgi:hypothetical protein
LLLLLLLLLAVVSRSHLESRVRFFCWQVKLITTTKAASAIMNDDVECHGLQSFHWRLTSPQAAAT